MTRIVLIDDDPIFCNIMVRFAKKNGVEIDYFNSLMDFESFGSAVKYDAAIVDFNLGSMTGLDIAEQLPVIFGDIPLILVSSQQGDRFEREHWPDTIKGFVPKQAGFDAIFTKIMSCLTFPQTPNLHEEDSRVWADDLAAIRPI